MRHENFHSAQAATRRRRNACYDYVFHLKLWHDGILEFSSFIEIVPPFGMFDLNFDGVEFLFNGLHFANAVSFFVPNVREPFLLL